MQRNGKHVDLYVYDLFLRLNARLPDLALFNKIEFIYATSTQPPSQLILRTTTLGLTLTAEKQDAAMQLRLQLPEPNPELASKLTDWSAGDENSFRCSVLSDAAEAAVFDIVTLIKSLSPEPTAVSTTEA
jgi:hypothetical protein